MGTRWAAQNILERYQDARLRVYVVWVKRWALDTRAEIDGAGMIDPRVIHLWDTGNVIGQGFPAVRNRSFLQQPPLPRLRPSIRRPELVSEVNVA
jgi:hypothetical protein